MNHDQASFDETQDSPPPVSRRSQLLRAAGDDFLDPDDSAALARLLDTHPDDRCVVDFERQLRDEVRALLPEAVPQELRTRIEALRSAPASPRPLRAGGARPWWSVSAAAMLGLATLGAAGWAWWASTQTVMPAPGQSISAHHRVAVVAFVSDQHRECEIHSALVAERFRIAPLQDAHGPLASILGLSPDMTGLDDERVRFLGSAECAVPGNGPSIHIVLDVAPWVQGSAESSLVSLFVQRDLGEINIEPGRGFWMSATDGEDTPILVWKRDGLIYFLRSSSASELEAVRNAVQAPQPTGTI